MPVRTTTPAIKIQTSATINSCCALLMPRWYCALGRLLLPADVLSFADMCYLILVADLALWLLSYHYRERSA